MPLVWLRKKSNLFVSLAVRNKHEETDVAFVACCDVTVGFVT